MLVQEHRLPVRRACQAVRLSRAPMTTTMGTDAAEATKGVTTVVHSLTPKTRYVRATGMVSP